MENKAKSVIKEMFNDYMIYGYSFKFFIEQDYSISKLFNTEELKEMWENVKNKLESEF